MSKSKDKDPKITDFFFDDRYISSEERATRGGMMMSKESKERLYKMLGIDKTIPSGDSDIFITDGEGRVFSQSEKDKFWEEFERNQEQQRYDKLYGKKKSKKKNPKSIIPEGTEIPDLKSSVFDDWKITMDIEKREFTLYHWGLKKTFSPTFDELGFRKGKKPENVKISTLLAYTHLKSIDDKSVIYIEHHNLMVENFGDSISTYRTYIQRVFRIYLNIDPSSKMFTRESVNYFDKPSVKKRINIYKCNSDLHTLILDKKRYNDDNIVDSNFLEYNDDINTNF